MKRMKYTMERPNVTPDDDVDKPALIHPKKYAEAPIRFRNKTTEYAASQHSHRYKPAPV